MRLTAATVTTRSVRPRRPAKVRLDDRRCVGSTASHSRAPSGRRVAWPSMRWSSAVNTEAYLCHGTNRQVTTTNATWADRPAQSPSLSRTDFLIGST